MNQNVDFLVRHGYSVLFAWILAEQSGLPLPSAPLLVSAGALAGSRLLSWPLTIATALIAATIGDTVWYILGIRSGGAALRLACRISLEPDSCVRRAQLAFERRGAWALPFAKFVPGLNTMMAPLAGASRMPWRRFIVLDTVGTLLWSSTYIAGGFLYRAQVEHILAYMSLLGGRSLVLLLVIAAVYIAWKWLARRRFLKKLKIARITPEELKGRIDAGENIAIVDLRHEIEFALDSQTILGAIRADPADMEKAAKIIPPGREIILFCSCPNEATAAQTALRLRNRGITRIRPLAEGFDGWRRRGFPMQPAAIVK